MARASLLLLSIIISLYACNGPAEEHNSSEVEVSDTSVTSPKPAPALGTDPEPLTEAQKLSYAELGIDADKGIPVGLKVGDMAPVFKQKDQHGNEIFLPDMYKNGPVVVMFYRGQWCPACDKYLSGLQDSIALIKNTGASVLIITPETIDNVNKTISNTGIDAHIISDNSGLMMNAFRVSFFVTEAYQEKTRNTRSTDIASNNGAKIAKLPVPATFIINQKGQVAWRQFNIDYHHRASTNDILQALSHL